MSGKLFFTAISSLQSMGSSWFKPPSIVPEGKEVRITAKYTCEDEKQALMLQRLLNRALSYVPLDKQPFSWEVEADKDVLKLSQYFSSEEVSQCGSLRIKPDFIQEGQDKLLFLVDQHLAAHWTEYSKEEIEKLRGRVRVALTPLEERDENCCMLNLLCYPQVELYEDFYKRYFPEEKDKKTPLYFFSVQDRACIIGPKEKVKNLIQKVQDEMVPPPDFKLSPQTYNLTNMCSGPLVKESDHPIGEGEKTIFQREQDCFFLEAEVFTPLEEIDSGQDLAESENEGSHEGSPMLKTYDPDRSGETYYPY